jgi:hypothetical protein
LPRLPGAFHQLLLLTAMKLTLDLPDDEAAALALLLRALSPPTIQSLGLTVPQAELALSAAVKLRQRLAQPAGTQAALTEQLADVVEEAIRISRAELILMDGLDNNGQPFTQAQRLDAKAFLSRRKAGWIHTAVAVAKAAGRQPFGQERGNG